MHTNHTEANHVLHSSPTAPPQPWGVPPTSLHCFPGNSDLRYLPQQR